MSAIVKGATGYGTWKPFVSLERRTIKGRYIIWFSKSLANLKKKYKLEPQETV